MRRKKLKAPPPTPEGMVWRTIRNEGTSLVTAEFARLESQRKMGNYDLYPQEVRDQIKENNRRHQSGRPA